MQHLHPELSAPTSADVQRDQRLAYQAQAAIMAEMLGIQTDVLVDNDSATLAKFESWAAEYGALFRTLFDQRGDFYRLIVNGQHREAIEALRAAKQPRMN